MINKKIIEDYLIKNHPNIERNDSGSIKGLFESNLQFSDESFLLIFNEINNGLFIRHRESRESKELTEEDFFIYLDILIEMDKSRIYRTSLRKILIYENLFTLYKRDKIINDII